MEKNVKKTIVLVNIYNFEMPQNLIKANEGNIKNVSLQIKTAGKQLSIIIANHIEKKILKNTSQHHSKIIE